MNEAIARGVCDKHGAKGKCLVSSCSANAQNNGGFCGRHGGKDGFCTAAGCDTPRVRGSRVCVKHGAHGTCTVSGHHHLPLLQHLAIQVAAARTLAAASRTARGAPASNPSFGTSGRSNFSAGSLRILNARLVACSRRRPCCGGCTGSAFRAHGGEIVATAMVLLGVTLVQLAVMLEAPACARLYYIFFSIRSRRCTQFFTHSLIIFCLISAFPRPLCTCTNYNNLLLLDLPLSRVAFFSTQANFSTLIAFMA